jgi:hypothetical protein
MATSSDTLFQEAACFRCNSNASMSDMLKLALWNQIVSAEAAVQSFIERAVITDPAQIAAIESLAESAVAHGWWGKCDLIYPFVGGNATAHAQNLKSSSFTITWNGAVTHDVNGITGDALTGYGDPAYVLLTAPRWGLNSAHMSLYRRSGGTAISWLFGALETLKSAGITRRTSPTDVGSTLNDGDSLTTHAFNPLALGHVVSSRTSATTIKVTDSLTTYLVAENSTGICTESPFILARNAVGFTAQAFTNSNLAAATAGSGLSQSEAQVMVSDWQTFQTALGRQV